MFIIYIYHVFLFLQSIVRQALIVMKTLAGNDEVKAEVSKLGGVELVVLAMNTHQNVSTIAEASCKLLTAITLRNPDNCRKVVECQGHQHIIQAMKLHPSVIGVQVKYLLAFHLFFFHACLETRCLFWIFHSAN